MHSPGFLDEHPSYQKNSASLVANLELFLASFLQHLQHVLAEFPEPSNLVEGFEVVVEGFEVVAEDLWCY